LPKAHLHLHFTGSMRHSTLIELADRDGIRLPESLRGQWPPTFTANDERGWFRFQRLYDAARAVLRTDADLRRLLREAAEDDAADGSRWLEIQVDPSGYGARFGGITRFTELVLDASGEAATATGVGIAVIISANRTKHPLDARILARLAAQYAGRGVVGFGLSNDERRGNPSEFERAFRIAARAGLMSAPHAGELCGPESVRACLDFLGANRIGHGIRSGEDPHLVERLAKNGTPLELCPSSNVGLGVYPTLDAVPLTHLVEEGVRVALGADDPLLFGSRLADQYAICRSVFGLDDQMLASLAQMSIRSSNAAASLQAELLREIDGWLAVEPTGVEPVPGGALKARSQP
jgi:adenosine deaminase